MMTVPPGHLANRRQDRVLDPRMKDVVIGCRAAQRWIRLQPGLAFRPDPADPLTLLPAPAQRGLQFRQRGGELQRWNQIELLAVEEPEQHLYHVLADRILARPLKG